MSNTGDIYTWGYNKYGQLGDNTTTNRHTPTKIGSSSWKAVASGSSHSLAIDLQTISDTGNFFLMFN